MLSHLAEPRPNPSPFIHPKALLYIVSSRLSQGPQILKFPQTLQDIMFPGLPVAVCEDKDHLVLCDALVPVQDRGEVGLN